MSSTRSLTNALSGLSMTSTTTQTGTSRKQKSSMPSLDRLLIVQLKGIVIIDSGSDCKAKEFLRPLEGWTLRTAGNSSGSQVGESLQLATADEWTPEDTFPQDLGDDNSQVDDLVLVLDMKDAKDVETPTNPSDDEDETQRAFQNRRIVNPYNTPKSPTDSNFDHKCAHGTSLTRTPTASSGLGGLTDRRLEVDEPISLALIEEETTIPGPLAGDEKATETVSMFSADAGQDVTGGIKLEAEHSSDIDLYDGDPILVSEYQDDICKYFKELEVVTIPDPMFMDIQIGIDWNNHRSVIDRLIQLRSKMKLLQETILLAVNLLHRFLSKRAVAQEKLDYVGLCCLLIATKYEEICAPSITQLLALCLDTSYTEYDIIVGEKFVLKTLDWGLQVSGPLAWLRRASQADDYDVKSRNLAEYLIDVSLVEKKLIGVVPSLLSASALWLARVASDRGSWNAELERSSTYSENVLLPVASIMVDYILVQPSSHSELYNFYDTQKHFKASSVLRRWCLDRWSENSTVDLSKGLSGGNKSDTESSNPLQPTTSDTQMVP